MEKNKKWMIVFLVIFLLWSFIIFRTDAVDFISSQFNIDISTVALWIVAGLFMLFAYFLLNSGKITGFRIILRWIVINILFFAYLALIFMHCRGGPCGLSSWVDLLIEGYFVYMAVITAVIGLIVYIVYLIKKKKSLSNT